MQVHVHHVALAPVALAPTVLPPTGSETVPQLIAAAAVVLVGAALFVVGVRRARRQPGDVEEHDSETP